MPIPYPHKQTLIILTVCAVAVVSTALYAAQQSPKNVTPKQLTVTSDSVGTSTLSSADWQKTFFGVAGTSSVKFGAIGGNKASDSAPLTLTDQFGREFFSKYIQLKQFGVTGNPGVKEDLGSELANSPLFSSIKPVEYTAKDIQISADQSAQAVKNYGNAIGTLLLNAPKTNEAAIALQSMKNNDPSLLEAIDVNIAGYLSIVAQARALPVPQSLANAHINFINGFSILIFSSQNLRLVNTDPMRGIIGTQTFLTSAEHMQRGIESMRTHMTTLNISYTTTEPGYLIMNPITQLRPLQ